MQVASFVGMRTSILSQSLFEVLVMTRNSTRSTYNPTYNLVQRFCIDSLSTKATIVQSRQFSDTKR